MPQAKRASKGKRPSKAVSVLGIAGVSLAASTGGSPAEMPSASLAAPTAGSVVEVWQNTASFQVPTLDEEEISDVSLATFHLFDKEDLGNSGSGMQLAAFRGEAAAADTAAEAAEAAAAFEAAEEAAEAAVGGCRGCRVGGCGGCGVARLRLGRLRRLRRLRLGLGLAAAACRGEVAPSGARLERLAITLTDARRHARV